MNWKRFVGGVITIERLEKIQKISKEDWKITLREAIEKSTIITTKSFCIIGAPILFSPTAARTNIVNECSMNYVPTFFPPFLMLGIGPFVKPVIKISDIHK